MNHCDHGSPCVPMSLENKIRTKVAFGQRWSNGLQMKRLEHLYSLSHSPLLLPGSEVCAWLSSGGSEGAEEKQLAKGCEEVRL